MERIWETGRPGDRRPGDRRDIFAELETDGKCGEGTLARNKGFPDKNGHAPSACPSLRGRLDRVPYAFKFELTNKDRRGLCAILASRLPARPSAEFSSQPFDVSHKVLSVPVYGPAPPSRPFLRRATDSGKVASLFTGSLLAHASRIFSSSSVFSLSTVHLHRRSLEYSFRAITSKNTL